MQMSGYRELASAIANESGGGRETTRPEAQPMMGCAIMSFIALALIAMGLGSTLYAVLLGALAVGCLIYAFVDANESAARKIREEEQKASEAAAWRAQLEESRRAKREGLAAEYGESVADRLMNKEIWRGQSAAMLRAALGEPDAMDERVLKSKTKHVWKYDEIRRGSYELKVTLEDGVVVGWDRKADD